MRVVDFAHDDCRFCDGVDQGCLVGRQWLDAIGDVVCACRFAGRRKCITRSRQHSLRRVTRRDHALLRRSMHKILRAHRGAQFTQAPHEGHGAHMRGLVRCGDRQAFGFDQQPVQAGDDEAMIGGDALQSLRFAIRHRRRVVAHGEGGNFQPCITERGSEAALFGERQRRQHFVAERELHRVTPGRPSCARPVPSTRPSRAGCAGSPPGCTSAWSAP